MRKRRKTKAPMLARENSPTYGSGAAPRPVYDLEARTEQFAREVRAFIKRLPHTLANEEDGRQLVRSSGSVGANYIEANESLSKKDFLVRIKTARKEAKESRYWLRLVDTGSDKTLEKDCQQLIREATELMNILSAIYRKTE
jgi:four helix bundle protein